MTRVEPRAGHRPPTKPCRAGSTESRHQRSEPPSPHPVHSPSAIRQTGAHSTGVRGRKPIAAATAHHQPMPNPYPAASRQPHRFHRRSEPPTRRRADSPSATGQTSSRLTTVRSHKPIAAPWAHRRPLPRSCRARSKQQGRHRRRSEPSTRHRRRAGSPSAIGQADARPAATRCRVSSVAVPRHHRPIPAAARVPPREWRQRPRWSGPTRSRPRSGSPSGPPVTRQPAQGVAGRVRTSSVAPQAHHHPRTPPIPYAPRPGDSPSRSRRPTAVRFRMPIAATPGRHRQASPTASRTRPARQCHGRCWTRPSSVPGDARLRAGRLRKENVAPQARHRRASARTPRPRSTGPCPRRRRTGLSPDHRYRTARPRTARPGEPGPNSRRPGPPARRPSPGVPASLPRAAAWAAARQAGRVRTSSAVPLSRHRQPVPTSARRVVRGRRTARATPTPAPASAPVRASNAVPARAAVPRIRPGDRRWWGGRAPPSAWERPVAVPVVAPPARVAGPAPIPGRSRPHVARPVGAMPRCPSTLPVSWWGRVRGRCHPRGTLWHPRQAGGRVRRRPRHRPSSPNGPGHSTGLRRKSRVPGGPWSDRVSDPTFLRRTVVSPAPIGRRRPPPVQSTRDCQGRVPVPATGSARRYRTAPREARTRPGPRAVEPRVPDPPRSAAPPRAADRPLRTTQPPPNRTAPPLRPGGPAGPAGTGCATRPARR